MKMILKITQKWIIADQICACCNLINGMNSPTNKDFFQSTHKKCKKKMKKIMSENFKGPSLFKPPSSKMSSFVVFIKRWVKFEKQHKKHM
jgi:hypothetical protein